MQCALEKQIVEKKTKGKLYLTVSHCNIPWLDDNNNGLYYDLFIEYQTVAVL